jgi:hypothetical protein
MLYDTTLFIVRENGAISKTIILAGSTLRLLQQPMPCVFGRTRHYSTVWLCFNIRMKKVWCEQVETSVEAGSKKA